MRKFPRLIEFLVLATLAIGGAPAAAAIWNWSTTPATNATADPSINWAEGMSPSSVNDSARAMMAALAGWRNDISGVNTTAGSSTAYTLATSEGLDTTPVTGTMVAFFAHVTSGANPTLTADGGNTYPIQLNAAAPASGTLVAGTPYRVSFTGSAWALEGGYGNPYSVALGGLMPSTAPAPPNSSFIVPAGQCISTTTYAAYWVQQGSPASGACPGGQFAVLDLRGRVPAMLDQPSGFSAAGRLTSAATGCGTAMTTVGAACANGVEGASISLAQLPTGITSTGSISVISSSSDIFFAPSGIADAQTAVGTPNSRLAASTTAFRSNITSTGTANLTSNNTSGSARPNVQPTSAVNYFLRVL